MGTAGLAPWILQGAGHLGAQAEPAVGAAQQQCAGVGGDGPAAKTGLDTAAFTARRVERRVVLGYNLSWARGPSVLV